MLSLLRLGIGKKPICVGNPSAAGFVRGLFLGRFLFSFLPQLACLGAGRKARVVAESTAN